MKKTGVFYHDVCGKEAYSSLAMGVADGFNAIEKEGLFKEPNIKWFESRRAKGRVLELFAVFHRRSFTSHGKSIKRRTG
jgi:hypothetical protein